MITYSTNWMGPVSMEWYRERNLTVSKTVVQEEDSKFTSRKKGDVYDVEEITEHWAGGRIDIRGVPDEPWGLEYSLPIMHGEDWNHLSDWLEDFRSQKLWAFDDLIAHYENVSGRKIRWAE